MCIIELVDYNELMLKDAKPVKKTTRRSRRGAGEVKQTAAAEATSAPIVEAKTEAPSAPEAPAESENEEK
jgi:large subunit ribosomal protein L17